MPCLNMNAGVKCQSSSSGCPPMDAPHDKREGTTLVDGSGSVDLSPEGPGAPKSRGHRKNRSAADLAARKRKTAPAAIDGAMVSAAAKLDIPDLRSLGADRDWTCSPLAALVRQVQAASAVLLSAERANISIWPSVSIATSQTSSDPGLWHPNLAGRHVSWSSADGPLPNLADMPAVAQAGPQAPDMTSVSAPVSPLTRSEEHTSELQSRE